MSLRLQLHVGHGKTGSSFLQSWLAANAARLLEQHQLLYLQRCPFTRVIDTRANQVQFSMGNGFILNPVLMSGVTRRRQRHWWRRICRQNMLDPLELASMVFSHEPWTRKLPANWYQLVQLCEVVDINAIDVLLFVRDPLDHAISVYGQMVKRHCFSGTIEDWLTVYDFPEVLLRFLNVLNNTEVDVSLRVEHFAKQRKNLTDCLLSWLMLPRESSWHSLSESCVNRSLTQSELTMIRWLNSCDTSLGLKTGEILINRLPQLKGVTFPPSRKAVQKFVHKWKSMVIEINDRLPSSAQLSLPCVDDQDLDNDMSSDECSTTDSITLSVEQFFCLLDALKQS